MKHRLTVESFRYESGDNGDDLSMALAGRRRMCEPVARGRRDGGCAVHGVISSDVSRKNRSNSQMGKSGRRVAREG
jgi:hypothetical protein